MNSIPLTTNLLFLATVAFVSVLLPLGVYKALCHQQKPATRTTLLTSIGLLIWAVLLAVPAHLGKFRFEGMPPTALFILVGSTTLTLVFAFSKMGRLLSRELPLALLIGFQVFRIPVELVLHQCYEAGLLPVQMTYAGMNFDILSGLSAPVVAWLYHRGRIPKGAVLAWNVICLGLLITIVTIAVLSMPLPIRAFHNDPANTLVAGFPFVWLPGILVQAALMGHILVFRHLSGSNNK